MEKNKIREQIKIFRKNQALADVSGKVVIVVDDGLATGSTMSAAIIYLQKKNAVKIIMALPIAALSSVQQFNGKGIEVIALEKRDDLMSVGQWYDDFSQVLDEQVIALLKKHTSGKFSKKISDSITIPVT